MASDYGLATLFLLPRRGLGTSSRMLTDSDELAMNHGRRKREVERRAKTLKYTQTSFVDFRETLDANFGERPLAELPLIGFLGSSLEKFQSYSLEGCAGPTSADRLRTLLGKAEKEQGAT
jgi:hypothetical protein